MKKLHVFLLLLFATSLFANPADDAAYYYSTKAKSGEGVIALLKRYDLYHAKCNVKKFYDLNGMKIGQGLQSTKQYQLPIKIYKYNGKSIRSTLGINDYEQALSIQKYNERIKAQGLRRKTIKDSKILWVPHHLVACAGEVQSKSELASSKVVVTAGVDKKSKTSKYSLFGKKHAHLTKIDNSLKGEVYFVVAGHGGPDPGARCTDCTSTMCEDEYAYDVALRLTKSLMEKGATVHMVIEDENDGIRDEKYLKCDRDERTMTGKKLPLRQLDRLKQRADIINRLSKQYKKKGIKKQKTIVIHVDSRGKNKRQDVYFYYYGRSKSGKKLAYNLKDTFEEKYKKYQRNRGYKGYIKDRGLYMLRKTDPTAVYVELANIRNKDDHKRLLLPENRQALANWLCEGLTK